jgi:CBS domain-containing protein
MTTKLADLCVADLMSIEPVTISESASLADAEQLMQRRGVTGLPVVDARGRLVGVVSQTDLLRAHVVDDHWARWPGLSVRHLMTAPALTIPADSPIAEAAGVMEEHHVHRLVVVDLANRPTGVLSTMDLVRSLVDTEELP